MKKINMLGMTEKELSFLFEELGEKKYRAVQFMEWVYKRKIRSFAEMTNFPIELREYLDANYCLQGLETLRKQISKKDGTIKYLFKLEDGETIETVLMPHDYGNSVCVSSQVGCKMGCGFCASAIGGFKRNLRAAEIFQQVILAEKELAKRGERVTHVVLMGTGEPLENLSNVLEFISLLHSPHSLNISYRNISLSTCGIVPKIIELSEMNLPITLSISLHAADNETRSALMPINKKYPLEVLIPACIDYVRKTKRRVTYEYILIRGINASPKDAVKLANLLRNHLCHVNIIPLNPVKEKHYCSPNEKEVDAFAEVLKNEGINLTIRKEMGADIDAACGQLRRRFLREKNCKC